MTVCDCKKGYWHQKLDLASSFLTNFNTEIGRFRYTVMPFGITVAGDVFQRQLDQCFGKIDQLIVIADDIMVVGKQHNHKDHDIALTNLLETTRRCNIRLNFDTLPYKKTEVDFFGEMYTTDGCKPAQSKFSAIVEVPPPTCRKQVQSFIGMVNYLSKFSVRLFELVEPIRELTKDKVSFNWGPECQAIFKQMKRRLLEPQYSLIIIQRKKPYCRQMQVSKDLVLACCKARSQSTLQVEHLQKHKGDMWP